VAYLNGAMGVGQLQTRAAGQYDPAS
jgi:hypothetical protein